MAEAKFKTMDGDEAAAYVAYRLSEVIAIYPITPASPMGEHADTWAARDQKNLWGVVPSIMEMQSEGGAAGTLHGALQGGSLGVTFTASQGLLLKIPNMYKIAGELTPSVIHVSARTLATHALSIFGDHSDVMGCRGTGWAMLASGSIQEVMDMAMISHAATLESRVPFLHFFDGFRTSHEIQKIQVIPDDAMADMIDEQWILDHRARSMRPDNPVLRGTAQNPDVFFQARERANPFYDATPQIVQNAMDKFAKLTGRQYHLFDYVGAKDAERVVVLMGSGSEAAQEAVEHLVAQGEKVGMVKVRLYRPFNVQAFMESLPATVKSISVLDRTKEPGSAGEPLYQDVMTALDEGLDAGYGELKQRPVLVGGRYGLSSKEFTPAMVKGALDNLSESKPRNHFTIGINDDVTNTSLAYDPDFSTEPETVTRALFYGIGSDGTVGANKNSCKIIGENTDKYVQAYFVYDSKKSGSITTSHLRFGPEEIHSTYLISKANFVAIHQPVFLEKIDMLQNILPGGTVLLNMSQPPEKVWDALPRPVQQQIIDKNLKVYTIDAYCVARDAGMGMRINTVMQTCFFAISGVLPRDEAIEEIKKSIRTTYGRKGQAIVDMNLACVDKSLENMHEVKIPDKVTSTKEMPPPVSDEAPAYVKDVLAQIMAGEGDALPVSAMPVDGTFPTATTQWEKRNIAQFIPAWEPDICIQCGKCAMVCPHATIRIKAYDPKHLDKAPETFQSADARNKAWSGMKYTVQIAPEDCTGCELCVDVCPAKDKKQANRKALNMVDQAAAREPEAANWDFFLDLPELDRTALNLKQVREQQMQRPLFEFSGACAGCGETPYVKLVSQLFGDRLTVANATGCSSIYGGNLPTTPWCVNDEGRGPTWSNSLFEDNAEFGLGFRLSYNQQRDYAQSLLVRLAGQLGDEFVSALINAEQDDEAEIFEQRKRVAELKDKLRSIDSPEARALAAVADALVRRSVWIMGGDGWAYDIGFGGLDHVLASGHDINVLVMDTEVYSNTGGQASKATPRAAVAKFAEAGKPGRKKDLGMIAMTYGNIYVARVAMGARDEHTLRSFMEAESYRGPSLIIAYSHCIAHGINLSKGLQQQKLAVDSGQWLLYRYDPRLTGAGKNPLQLDSREPKVPVADYMSQENRFKMLTKSRPEEARAHWEQAQREVDQQWQMYQAMANQQLQATESAAD